MDEQLAEDLTISGGAYVSTVRACGEVIVITNLRVEVIANWTFRYCRRTTFATTANPRHEINRNKAPKVHTIFTEIVSALPPSSPPPAIPRLKATTARLEAKALLATELASSMCD